MLFRCLLFVFFLLACGSKADQLTTFNSGNWSGGAYSIDGKFSHCSMLANYPNGNILLFKIYANGTWSVGIANSKFNFKPGQPIKLQASVDGADPTEISGETISTSQISFPFSNISSFLIYKKASRLRFYIVGATSLPFDLTGFAAASDVLHQCYRHQMGLDADAAISSTVVVGPKSDVSKTVVRPSSNPNQAKSALSSDKEASGSGVVINKQGQIITNAHVIENCGRLAAGVTSRTVVPAKIIAVDERNDLAVIQPDTIIGEPIIFREGKGLRPGEDIVALGYPYSGLLASEANVGRGSVTALSGLMDDSRFVQISAPIQPGNSGGPLLDMQGRLGGINTSTLNALLMVKATGSVPQNVNFSIKASVVRDFLDAKAITYEVIPSTHTMSPEEVSEIGRRSTVLIECNASK
jgi:S1-C subfamily serine protease